MQEFARFAATFLSALAVTASLSAADLRDLRAPRDLETLWAKTSRLRLVNVWATWCVPCVAEMPDLQAIDDAFGAELAVVGVSLDDMIPGARRERVTLFLDKKKITFANGYYTGLPDELGEYLRFNGEIPVTVIFDAKGDELWRHQGRLDRKKTVAVIRDLFGRNR